MSCPLIGPMYFRPNSSQSEPGMNARASVSFKAFALDSISSPKAGITFSHSSTSCLNSL